jgi:hypothetical protein
MEGAEISLGQRPCNPIYKPIHTNYTHSKINVRY